MTDDPADFGSGIKRGDRVRVVTKAGDLPHATVTKVNPVFGDDGSWRGDLIRVQFDGHEGTGTFGHEMVENLDVIEQLGEVGDSHWLAGEVRDIAHEEIVKLTAIERLGEVADGTPEA